jgi:hypothetical protein
MTIFALSHGAHSDAKILFAGGEKDGGFGFAILEKEGFHEKGSR